ncbi:MAG: DUF4097 domain-containing protein [Candidatus Babeliales bacterium]
MKIKLSVALFFASICNPVFSWWPFGSSGSSYEIIINGKRYSSENSCFSSQLTEKETRTESASNIKNLDAKTSSGKIDVVGQPYISDAIIDMVFKASQKEEIERMKKAVIIQNKNNTLFVKDNIPPDCFSCSIDFNVKVPQQINIDASAASGNISVKAVTGFLKFLTASGDVTTKHIGGGIQGKTKSGNIYAENIKGDANLKSSSGKIFAGFVQGNLFATNSSGSIKAQDIKKNIRTETTSGDIKATNIGGNAECASSSGSIFMDAVRGSLWARAISGSINASKVRDSYDFKTTSGNIFIQKHPEFKGAFQLAKTVSGRVKYK